MISLALTKQFTKPLVFSVVVDFGGRGPVAERIHRIGIAAFELHFVDHVSFFPKAARRIGRLSLTNRPAFDLISNILSRHAVGSGD